MPCPGYRNLADVMFRDESQRTIRKVQATEKVGPCAQGASPSYTQTLSCVPGAKSYVFPSAISIPHSIVQPINDLGARFFFIHYSEHDVSFSKGCGDWLAWSYWHDRSSHALQAAIEAVGLAGMSNVLRAQHAAQKAKERYGKALIATNRALGDPAEATTDATLMAILLLGVFEVNEVLQLRCKRNVPHLTTDDDARKLGSVPVMGRSHQRCHGPAAASGSRTV